MCRHEMVGETKNEADVSAVDGRALEHTEAGLLGLGLSTLQLVRLRRVLHYGDAILLLEDRFSRFSLSLNKVAIATFKERSTLYSKRNDSPMGYEW